MKSKFLLGALALASVSHASTMKTFGPDVGTVLEKVSQCLPEFEDATLGASAVREVTFVSPKPANPKLQVNTYTIETVGAGKPFATLAIVETIDSTGIVAKVTFDCKVTKP